jgi:hypothetical protein
MLQTLYLAKANDDVISHCQCRPEDALITWPPQMDCPWCGCGWLFTCIHCRKAFTFAKPVSVNLTLAQLGRLDLRNRSGEEPADDDVERWVRGMDILLRHIIPRETYVCLDGYFLPANSEAVTFEGWAARHDLPRLPQSEAVTNPRVLELTLANRGYWEQRRIESAE